MKNIAILGAAGRDYHNFLVKYKDNPLYKVKFFTAAQIPGIEKRSFPKELAGKLYKEDIPFFSEDKLVELIKKYDIDEVVLSYSDLSHNDVMHKASIALSCGANFVMLGPKETMIKSKKPVISVCAVRTGAGKSQTSKKIAQILKENGKRVVAIRHPMPYGDLIKEKVQRFATYEDLTINKCTIEEREEYEPWIKSGFIIYAGVDYKEILDKAEKEADVILWDGGNNDFSFYHSDLLFVVADPHRPGHELLYHPGETNIRMADIIIINKIDTAKKEQIKILENNINSVNKKAVIIKAESEITLSSKLSLKGKRALVIEDGPTLTHGGMKIGAGFIIAKRKGCKIVSPIKYAVGSIKETYKKYSHLKYVLPAMGYSSNQIKDLEKTINKTPCDIVIDGSPVNLSRLIKINKPIIDVAYSLKEKGLSLKEVLKKNGFI